MKKPDSCKSCPLYRDGEGFVPDLLFDKARILVIEMFPTTYEMKMGASQEGLQVEEYKRNYERHGGIRQYSYAHLIRCRGQRGTVLPKGKLLKEGVKHCRQYDVVPESTKLILLQGEEVAKLLRPDLGNTSEWRGFILPPVETPERELAETPYLRLNMTEDQ